MDSPFLLPLAFVGEKKGTLTRSRHGQQGKVTGFRTRPENSVFVTNINPNINPAVMVEAKDVRAGEWIIFNREPYKVKRKETVTAGTHMHSKTKLIMQGLFSQGEKSAVYAHHDKLDVAEVEMKSGQIISISGSVCQIMDNKTYETVEAELPKDSELKEGVMVVFALYNGKNLIIEEARKG